MAKRILPALCALLLSIALVGLCLAAGAKASLLNGNNARQAMAQSGFVAARAETIRETLGGFFAGAGLDSAGIESAVDEAIVEQHLHESIENLLLGSPTGVTETEGLFAGVHTETLAALQADGSTVTKEGLEQLGMLVHLCEGVFGEYTIAPMAGVITGLHGILGAGSGVASIVLCVALVVLALFGVVWLTRGTKTAGLYTSSALLGAGLALLVPTALLHARRVGMTVVMSRYYAPFYGLLTVAGAVLAAAGLVWLVARLLLARKKAQ